MPYRKVLETRRERLRVEGIECDNEFKKTKMTLYSHLGRDFIQDTTGFEAQSNTWKPYYADPRNE
jgi:hypothetical protein